MLKSFLKKDLFAKERELFHACETGNFKKVKQLCFDKTIDINCFGKHMDRPLNLAADKGYFNIVKYLIDNGAHINSKGKCHRTPLFRALLSNNIKIAEFLLENNADIREMPIFFWDNKKIINLLIKKRRETTKKIKKELENYIIPDICNIIITFVF